jgi:hypothetical protein
VVGAKIVREAKSGLTYGRKMLGKILFGEKYFEFSEKKYYDFETLVSSCAELSVYNNKLHSFECNSIAQI